MHPPILHACMCRAAQESSHSAQQHGLVFKTDRHAPNQQDMHALIGHNMPVSTIDTTCMPQFKATCRHSASLTHMHLFHSTKLLRLQQSSPPCIAYDMTREPRTTRNKVQDFTSLVESSCEDLKDRAAACMYLSRSCNTPQQSFIRCIIQQDCFLGSWHVLFSIQGGLQSSSTQGFSATVMLTLTAQAVICNSDGKQSCMMQRVEGLHTLHRPSGLRAFLVKCSLQPLSIPSTDVSCTFVLQAFLSISCCCQVRLAFLQMVADWMLTLRERIDHHARLMPYALSALSDSSKEVQMAALKLMDDLGAQYEEEHKQELKVQFCLSVSHNAVAQ